MPRHWVRSLSDRARCGRFAPLQRCALETQPLFCLLFHHSSNQAYSNAYPRYFIVAESSLAHTRHATLTQKLQFDTDDRLEGDLPLRSRGLSLSSCFMRMERGPAVTIPRASLQGLIQLSDMHMSQLYSLPTTPLASQPVLPASQILQNAQRAHPLLAN